MMMRMRQNRTSTYLVNNRNWARQRFRIRERVEPHGELYRLDMTRSYLLGNRSVKSRNETDAGLTLIFEIYHLITIYTYYSHDFTGKYITKQYFMKFIINLRSILQIYYQSGISSAQMSSTSPSSKSSSG